MEMYGGNVRKLDNEFTRQHEQKIREHHKIQAAKKISGRQNIIRLSLSCVFVIFALLFTFQIISAHASLNSLNSRIQAKSVSIGMQKAETVKLNQEVKQLNDKDYVEKIIRDKYYYTKPGETVYSFPNEVANDVK